MRFSVRERSKRDYLALPFLPTRLALGERIGSACQIAVTAIFRTLWRDSSPAQYVAKNSK